MSEIMQQTNLVDHDELTYEEKLHDLSVASVEKNFDPFVDIAWDDPELSIRHDDPRWILSPHMPLGRSQWYLDQPIEKQIFIGRYENARIAKVGLQFEQILVSGIMQFNINKSPSNPEFRYSMHEAREETNHIQMFGEGIRRAGIDAKGAPKLFTRVVQPLAGIAAEKFPSAFMVGVLAGEEPIDHLQKSLLRDTQNEQHPLMQQIMGIHVAEESRHIGFAHLYLQKHGTDLPTPQKVALAALTPLIQRVVADVIMRPSKEALAEMGIPEEVAAEVWKSSPEAKQRRKDLFPDVRMLADEIGIRGKGVAGAVGSLAWKLCGIDGRSSRYRNEPPYRAIAQEEVSLTADGRAQTA